MSEYPIDEAIQGVENFVAEEIAKLKVIIVSSRKENTDKIVAFQNETDKKIKTLDEKIENLQAEQSDITKNVSEMEEKLERLEKKTEDIFQRKNDPSAMIEKVLNAGLAAINKHGDGQATFLMTSTPVSYTRSLSANSNPMGPISTRTFYGDNNPDISAEVLQQLEPFLGPSSSHDKLTPIQRAFIRHYLHKHTTDPLNDITVNRCIQEGVDSNIWNQDYCPEGVNDLATYLKESMRNLRKKEKRSDYKKSQKRRLSEYVQRSLTKLSGSQLHSDDFSMEPDMEDNVGESMTD